ncbi:sugar transferase [Polymorphobacter fuscus]|nr:sugar transferase [Polymorphobacter fuscus]NJC08767.1 lipopolysaccharide/colanic/teichoic acid biosynthesis glycosyltransferase [Polymorphobacter fuscus]
MSFEPSAARMGNIFHGSTTTWPAPAPLAPTPAADAPVSRALDIVIAIAALVVFAPIMLICALAVAASNNGPVLFRQQRIGRDGALFSCLKFRTMRTDAAEVLDTLLATCPAAREEWQRNHKLQNDPRIIGAGSFLRKTSLDELPQLFNVLAGDMAIVGPRPIVPAEIARYGRYIGAYCAVRPGITGLWQVQGRSATTYRRRIACDIVYSRAKSPAVDLRIIACTIPAVILGRGAC